MVQPRNSEIGGTNDDSIAAHLTAIAAKLESLESLKKDVAVLAQMLGYGQTEEKTRNTNEEEGSQIIEEQPLNEAVEDKEKHRGIQITEGEEAKRELSVVSNPTNGRRAIEKQSRSPILAWPWKELVNSKLRPQFLVLGKTKTEVQDEDNYRQNQQRNVAELRRKRLKHLGENQVRGKKVCMERVMMQICDNGNGWLRGKPPNGKHSTTFRHLTIEPIASSSKHPSSWDSRTRLEGKSILRVGSIDTDRITLEGGTYIRREDIGQKGGTGLDGSGPGSQRSGDGSSPGSQGSGGAVGEEQLTNL